MARIAGRLLAVALLSAWAQGAFAQKAKDTLRVGFLDPISTAEVAIDPKPETILTDAAIFDGLVWYDPASGEYKPLIAESWTRPNDRTIDFKLKKGIKFHDGSELTADDVVYTYTYLTDPASKLRFVTLDFVDHAEKIDDYTVRVVEKRPTSFDLAKFDVAIYPKAIHSKLADKSEFGRKHPIGTGPYKLDYIDATRGILLVRNENYNLAAPWRPKGGVARIQILPVPDVQTQIAQLMVGDLDMVHDVPKDLVDQLKSDPRIAVTASPGPNYFYLNLDAAKRTRNTALADPDVRRALQMSVDRGLLAKEIVPGGAVPINALCVPAQSDCPKAADVDAPGYDVEGAKKLLAKAGFANGFEIDLMSIPGAQSIAEAVAGQFQKIGVRASVVHMTIGAYRERQASNKQEALVAHFWSRGASPATSFENFFTNTPRDYTRDPEMMKFYDRAAAEFDQQKRVSIWREAFNYMLAHGTVLPLTTYPAVVAHTKDIEVGTGAMNPGGIDLNRIVWK